MGLISLSLTQKGEVLNVKMFIPFQAGHRDEKNHDGLVFRCLGCWLCSLLPQYVSPRAGVNY